MLEDMARHEENRTGQNEGTMNDVGTILNTERSQQKHATLQRYRHPAAQESKKLQVPAKCKHVDEMWEILKEEGHEIDKIEWKTIPTGQETTYFMLR